MTLHPSFDESGDYSRQRTTIMVMDWIRRSSSALSMTGFGVALPVGMDTFSHRFLGFSPTRRGDHPARPDNQKRLEERRKDYICNLEQETQKLDAPNAVKKTDVKGYEMFFEERCGHRAPSKQ